MSLINVFGVLGCRETAEKEWDLKCLI